MASVADPRVRRIDPPRNVEVLHDGAWWPGSQRAWIRWPDGTWLGLAGLYRGYMWDGAELDWYPADELRTLD